MFQSITLRSRWWRALRRDLQFAGQVPDRIENWIKPRARLQQHGSSDKMKRR
jgi:hypothetical protein